MRCRAFELRRPAEGDWITVEKSFRVANRLRTRDREIRVLQLHPEGSSPSCVLSIVDRCGKTLAAAHGEDLLSSMDSIVLTAETSFYIVADIPAGTRYVHGSTIAEIHPLLVDLGTWIDNVGWRPSGGPRIYAANLRFEVGPARRRSARAAQVLGLAAQGLTDKAISERLGIGISTVETHWRLLRERGGFASRTEAVACHFFNVSERAREDLEAQRDRLVAEAWLHKVASPASLTPRTQGEMRSWPLP